MPNPSDTPSLQGMLLKNSTAVKMTCIGVIVLLLLIPLELIDSVLAERLKRCDNAVSEITSTWGKEQIIVGPILIIPYKHTYKIWKDYQQKEQISESTLAYAYFLPSEIHIEGTISPQKLHRGIYEAVVYNGSLKFSGKFRPEFERVKLASKDVVWEEAMVTFAISDLRGTGEMLKLKWGQNELELAPGCKMPQFFSGVTALVNVSNTDKEIPYQLDLKVNGSKRLQFAPLGIQNKVKLTSSWPDPSFNGAFLPTERNITQNGFDATWQVSYYGRNYPQQWTDQDKPNLFTKASLDESLFGVSFISLIDSYRTVERSIKYGLLFIAVIMTVFFLFEILSNVRIHPLQYTLVGFALCLFYLGLLSLSEFFEFSLSYSVGAAASSFLITLYSLALLKSIKRCFIVLSGLAVSYGFLYVILQMQDHSLLTGTGLLFVLLAIVMYATRNINWYKQE